MRLLAIFGAFLLLSSAVMVGEGSYGLKISATSTESDGFHGTHSAILDYNRSIRYIRIDLIDPIALDKLDDFCIQAKPLTENGVIYIGGFRKT